MTEENHGLEQAKAKFNSIKEMLEAVVNAETDEQRDDAERAISEHPLSIAVRSDWYSPGEEKPPAGEYEILLCTGGPAVRIRGDLDRGTPTSARLEHQDWFKPWTQYHLADQSVLLAYAQHFWFGE